MSYNKLKSLVANVEAIETAMKIQVQGRQATAEEKEILSRYSGFGGIKEVLNIGTDKPISGDMQEPIQRLQELINAYFSAKVIASPSRVNAGIQPQVKRKNLPLRW